MDIDCATHGFSGFLQSGGPTVTSSINQSAWNNKPTQLSRRLHFVDILRRKHPTLARPHDLTPKNIPGERSLAMHPMLGHPSYHYSLALSRLSSGLFWLQFHLMGVTILGDFWRLLHRDSPSAPVPQCTLQPLPLLLADSESSCWCKQDRANPKRVNKN